MEVTGRCFVAFAVARWFGRDVEAGNWQIGDGKGTIKLNLKTLRQFPAKILLKAFLGCREKSADGIMDQIENQS